MNLLILIGILEGYTTLAVQIIGMRTAVPVVGSSIILTSIYIGIILMALSSGYYLGGIVASRTKKKNLPVLLFCYLLFSGLYYALVTFSIHEILLENLLSLSGSYIVTLFISATILFFIPICLASQTIPIVTELSTIKSKGQAAGSMLFRSTVGSFLGSVVTSIFLFETIGVFNSSKIVVIIMIVTACLCLFLYKKKRGTIALGIAVIVSFCYYFFLGNTKNLTFVYDSSYQKIEVKDITIQGESGKVFHSNSAYSSAIFTKTKESPFGYIREAVTLTKKIKPKNVLVIGTAGFTYPNEIAELPYVNRVDAVDIDPSVKWIAEEHFLEKKLSDNIVFYPESARYFVNNAIREGKQYDLVFIDAYNGKYLPDELITKEFFESLGKIAPKEVILFNKILDNEGSSVFSKNVATTLSEAFGETYAKIVSADTKASIVNKIVTGKQYDNSYKKMIGGGKIYTDDRRSSEKDLVKMHNRDK